MRGHLISLTLKGAMYSFPRNKHNQDISGQNVEITKEEEDRWENKDNKSGKTMQDNSGTVYTLSDIE